MIRIAFKSLLNRKSTVLLTLLSVTMCVTLLLGVERLRSGLKESFGRTVSGVDLIAGPRSGTVNLLLYAVFHMGDPINTIQYDSWRHWADQDEVAWSVPVALGDSHRGFCVVGTTNGLFEHYRYGQNQPLELAAGDVFDNPFDVVMGADAASQLGYKTGDPVVVSHGTGQTALSRHDNLPFAVSGILRPTGTPLDRSLFVPLEGLTAIHIGWDTGLQPKSITPEQVLQTDLTPKTITAFFIGLKKKNALIGFQRRINTFADEPLSAVLPGIALFELWKMMSAAENSLALISVFVVLVSLVGMLITQMTALSLRRREMALLRSFGAGRGHLFRLLFLESLLIAGAGSVAGLILLYPVQILSAPLLSRSGLYMPVTFPSLTELGLLSAAWAAGLIIGLIPAWTVYRQSLHESLIVKN